MSHAEDKREEDKQDSRPFRRRMKVKPGNRGKELQPLQS